MKVRGWLLWLTLTACEPAPPPSHATAPASAPREAAAEVAPAALPEKRAMKPSRPRDFSDAKRALRKLYDAGERRTLYEGCAFRKWQVDWPRCCFDPGRAERRRLEWEHVVPAAAFGRSFPEWRDGHPDCVKRGKPFRGRKCATRASVAFRHMEGDMHNLFPAIGEINERRGDLPIGLVPGEPRELGSCDIEIDGVFEPPPEARGDVARAYLYMASAYGTPVLDADTRQLCEAWHAADPPGAEERERNDHIERVQGNRNPWLD